MQTREHNCTNYLRLIIGSINRRLSVQSINGDVGLDPNNFCTVLVLLLYRRNKFVTIGLLDTNCLGMALN